MQRAPVRWYETVPALLQKQALLKLLAMAKKAEASLQEEFGLPLGLIIIDTIAASAGYARPGDENDNAVGQAMMNILKTVAQELNCFVLGIDHFGKTIESGTRGANAKESSADIVLACLGNREVSGSVTDTRLAVRKSRGGRQGQQYPFTLRVVEALERDEDGDPITTMVVDWQQGNPAGEAGTQPDPWTEPRRQDQRTAVLRLKRVLMGILADRGVELPIPSNGPIVRMVDQELVREQFYLQTSADGTQEQKGRSRRQQFRRALEWAEEKQLVGVGEIDGKTYLWLVRQQPTDAADAEDGNA